MNKSPENKKPYVAVLSGIGKGKTRITRLIRDHRNFAPIFEPVDNNNYLKRFYTEDQGMKTWAALSQLRFLADRLTIQAYELPKLLASPDNDGVIEDSHRKQDNSYAWLHHKDGNINEEDWDLYKTFNRLGNQLSRPPDLIIHPLAELTVEQERIRKRIEEDPNRKFEKEIAPEYLTLVDQAILYAIDELVRAGSAVLEYDTNHRNLVSNEEDIQHFLDTFDAKLVAIGFTQFANYQPRKK